MLLLQSMSTHSAENPNSYFKNVCFRIQEGHASQYDMQDKMPFPPNGSRNQAQSYMAPQTNESMHRRRSDQTNVRSTMTPHAADVTGRRASEPHQVTHTTSDNLIIQKNF